MEYCSGGSISDIMAAADAPLDEDLIAYVCRETLAGLVYLHSMGKVGGLQRSTQDVPLDTGHCCVTNCIAWDAPVLGRLSGKIVQGSSYNESHGLEILALAGSNLILYC